MIRLLFYRTYHRAWGIAEWVTRRFTSAGKLALACLLVAGAWGVDTTQSTAYQAWAFLLAIFLVAALSLGFRRRRASFTVTRRLPRFGTVGEPLTYGVTVRGVAGRGLTLLEDLADPRPAWAEFAPRSPVRTPGVGWVDEAIGFTRWMTLVARRRPAVIAAAELAESGEARVTFTPRRRGRVEFRGVTVARTDVFGLARRFDSVRAPQSLVMLPKRYRLPPLAVPGVREYQPLGVALASAVGQSDEFVALRDYRPGDPVRHIHWRSVAKLDRLVVREHEDEFFVRHALVLDTFAVGDDDAAFEEAVAVAASFVCAIQTQESLLDLLFVGPQAFCFTAGRGVGHGEQMLEVLAGVQPCASRGFEALATLVLRHAARVSGCVCVLLAWDEARRELVRRLRALGIPVRVCVVTHEERAAEADVVFLPVGKVQEALWQL